MNSERMTKLELRASASLASIYALRMFGMFSILPVFALYALTIPGGDNRTLVGMALGAYGITQACLQLPFGWLSDHFGRKRVIYAGLILFALGSFVAGSAHDIYMTIIGRAIQGSGAISAAVMALAADLTREEQRTKAMALIGASIGVTFAISLVAGPALYHWIGIPGIFTLTGILALIAIAVVYRVVPDPLLSRFHSDTEAAPAKFRDVLRDPELLRLNFGILALHAAQMAMFVVIPFALKSTGGMDEQHHWQVYLPVVLLSFVLMLPAIIYGEKYGHLKKVFVGAIGLLLIVQLSFISVLASFWGIVATLTGFFVAFNILEASLPSLVSKIAPAGTKGTAIGVYNTCQSLGLALGAAIGGYLAQHFGASAVFIFGATLIGIWLLLAVTMKIPPDVRSKMYHVNSIDPARATLLSNQLKALSGVLEAVVIAEDCVAYLKVDIQHWDEAGALKLINEES